MGRCLGALSMQFIGENNVVVNTNSTRRPWNCCRNHRASEIMTMETSASYTQTLMALLILVLGVSLPNRARAQDAPAPYADTSLRNSVTRISADSNQTVRLATRATGRLQGNNVSLRGDSVSVSTYSEILTVTVVDVDSMWVQRGTAAPIVGLIFGVPCALYGGLVGAFIGGDPDGNGSPRRATVGLIIGMAGGGAVCGSVGAVIGSLIRRWRLEYARPTVVSLGL